MRTAIHGSGSRFLATRNDDALPLSCDATPRGRRLDRPGSAPVRPTSAAPSPGGASRRAARVVNAGRGSRGNRCEAHLSNAGRGSPRVPPVRVRRVNAGRGTPKAQAPAQQVSAAPGNPKAQGRVPVTAHLGSAGPGDPIVHMEAHRRTGGPGESRARVVTASDATASLPLGLRGRADEARGTVANRAAAAGAAGEVRAGDRPRGPVRAAPGSLS